MMVNPKTQAVIDAFLDLDAPSGIRLERKVKLKSDRPKLYDALEALVDAVVEKNA